MTHDQPGLDLTASVPAGPVREWLAAAPADEVAEGLDAAADPGAALTGLVRLLEALVLHETGDLPHSSVPCILTIQRRRENTGVRVLPAPR